MVMCTDSPLEVWRAVGNDRSLRGRRATPPRAEERDAGGAGWPWPSRPASCLASCALLARCERQGRPLLLEPLRRVDRERHAAVAAGVGVVALGARRDLP